MNPGGGGNAETSYLWRGRGRATHAKLSRAENIPPPHLQPKPPADVVNNNREQAMVRADPEREEKLSLRYRQEGKP